ncbi:hypothetical protein C8J57DRAFT_1718228 [Mycena rebaudengoi]|nr:hypothetical protein C8J57DRAFT_1718228 [Mycena rebaudengoi]
MPGSSVARKWHLVAYFSDCDKDRLPVIENYDLQSIQSPHHSHDIDQKTYMKANRPSLREASGLFAFNIATHFITHTPILAVSGLCGINYAPIHTPDA